MHPFLRSQAHLDSLSRHTLVAASWAARRPALTPERAQLLRDRAAAREQRSALAKEFGISRETVDNHLRAATATG